MENKAQTSEIVTEQKETKTLQPLMKKMNALLNENTQLRNKNRDYEKLEKATLAFLEAITTKNPLHKDAGKLLEEFKSRMEKHKKPEKKAPANS